MMDIRPNHTIYVNNLNEKIKNEPSQSIQQRWIDWHPLKKPPLVQRRQRRRLQRNRIVSRILGAPHLWCSRWHMVMDEAELCSKAHLMYLEQYLSSLPVRFCSSQTYLMRQTKWWCRCYSVSFLGSRKFDWFHSPRYSICGIWKWTTIWCC